RPSAATTESPNSATTASKPGVPGSTTSRAIASASMTTAPCSASSRATVLLPEPTPPVSPTRMGVTLAVARVTALSGQLNAEWLPVGSHSVHNQPLNGVGGSALTAGQLLAQRGERLVRRERPATVLGSRNVGAVRRRLAGLGRRGG